MATRTTRFAGPILIDTTAPFTLWTVPLGRIDLVKSVRFVNVTETPQTFDYCINVHDEAHALLWRATIEPGDLLIDRIWWPALTGEDVLITCDLADAVTVTVAGARLIA